jgi:hypothetical protein
VVLGVRSVVLVRPRPPVAGVIEWAGVGTKLDGKEHEEHEGEGNKDERFHARTLFAALHQSKSKHCNL